MTALLRAGDGSAYEALRTVREKQPKAGALVEMRGERGEPAPQQWTLLFSDPSARGGVREITVAGDVIVSERTPLRGYAGTGALPQVDLTKLNLDSNGAFRIANKEAAARKVGFNWVDYALRSHSATGEPMWVLILFDHMGAQTGTIQISAVNGAILSPPNLVANPRQNEKTKPSSKKSKGGFFGEVKDFSKRAYRTVSDGTQNAAGTVEEFFTGERTIGPKAKEEE